MDKSLQDAFLEELIAKCDFAEIALGRIRYLISEKGLHTPVFLFEALMSYLHHTASISLVLWPSGLGKNKDISKADRYERGEYLRAILGVTGSSILSERKFRDHIAHMDERLEDWSYASRDKNRARFCLGSLAFVSTLGQQEQKEIFETFDKNLFLFAFRGETLSIADSFEEVQAIRLAAIRKRGFNLSIFVEGER